MSSNAVGSMDNSQFLIFNVNFEEAGYQTNNVVRNIKSFFIYIVILLILLVAYKITSKLSAKYPLYARHH
jgi:hypothetical protein